MGLNRLRERNQMARVLVVEDNVILRYSLAHWLREEGHEVLEAATADEAWRPSNPF